MTTIELMLVLRHRRVLPKLFMLVERLGAECLDMQAHFQPGQGGRLKLTLACSPLLSYRLKTQIEKLIDVTEIFETCQETVESKYQETVEPKYLAKETAA